MAKKASRHQMHYEPAMLPVSGLTAAPMPPSSAMSWLSGNGINLAVLASVIFGGLTFYFTTNSTLAIHSKQFEKFEERERINSDAREKVRSDFITNSQKTSDSLAALNTETKIQSEQLKGIKESVDKLARVLEASAVRPPR